jgi:hypothetical protein
VDTVHAVGSFLTSQGHAVGSFLTSQGHAVGSFLTSRDFAVNFVANLAGVLIGVLLAFRVERRRARRDADILYGNVLRSSRSELGYFAPMITSTNTLHSFTLPATKALLIGPSLHERGPYSLVMALTALINYAGIIETSIQRVERLPGDKTEFNRQLGDSLGRLHRTIAIAVERLDSELGRLGRRVKTADADTQEISRRLREIFQNSAPPDSIDPGGPKGK